MAVQGKQIVDYLMQYLGTPYKWGGSNPDTNFDCSGLLQWGFKHFGIDIPRVTYDQVGVGSAVGMKDLQVGDAVFFEDDSSQSGPDHVGIYIGNGKMLHAPHTGDVVKISDISTGWYADHFAGGRRFNGVIGGGDANTDWSSQSPVEKKLSPEEYAGKYGWAYSFLNSDPSLKTLFDQAVADNWTTDKFQAEFRKTDFWQKNSDTARQALQMKTSDPATWAAKMDANKLSISELAAKVGAVIPDGQLPKLAEQAAMFNMGEDELRQILAGYVDFHKGAMNGEAGMYEHGMRQYAESMGVDMGQQSIKNYAQLMIKGLSSTQDFKNFVNDQAASAFPAFADQIKSGQTMSQIANPYIQMMAQNLEVNPNSLSLKDPTIKAALNGVDESGKPTGKNLVDFEDSLRGDPRWRSTQQTQDKTMTVGRSVLQSMGMIS